MENQKGILKIISGIVLVVVGIFGFLFGKTIRTALLRASVMAVSVGAVLSGAYLFIDGTTDLAIGQVGKYKFGQSYVQPMNYFSKAAFEDGLKNAVQHQQDLRRLKFECPDGSNSFTVYNTVMGFMGIPEKNVVCKDNFPLLTYGGGFVRERPQ